LKSASLGSAGKLGVRALLVVSLVSPGRRNEDISRAAAAWLARRRFGYKVGEIAKALSYAGHGG